MKLLSVDNILFVIHLGELLNDCLWGITATFFIVHFQHIRDSFLRIILSRIERLVDISILKIYDAFYCIFLQENYNVYFSSILLTLIAIVLTFDFLFFLMSLLFLWSFPRLNFLPYLLAVFILSLITCS